MTIQRILGSVFFVTLTACAAEATESPAIRVCSEAHTQRIAVNGVSLQRIALNGIQSNGIQNNGIQGNGIQANGVQNNGVQIDGVRLEGIQQSGIRLGAVSLDVGRTVMAVLSDGKTLGLTVTATERSAEQPDVVLHELSYQGESICADGTKGVFVPGVWDGRAAHHASDTMASFSCVSGAIAKCVLWGYDPERVGAGLHQACTRMVRADYCGTGESFTRDGTSIDLFDTRGIQRAANEPGFSFEAGWSEKGAVCVSRPRLAGDVPSCWSALPACSTFDEAKTHGATMANLSRPSREVCR